MNALTRFALLSCMALPLVAQEPGKQPATKPADATAKTEPPKTLTLGTRVSGEVTLNDLDGKPVKAHDFMGKLTVVNFFSIDCPIQGKWNARIAGIQKDFAAQGVEFLHIDSNTTEIDATEKGGKKLTKEENLQRIRDFLKTNKLEFRVLVDNGNKVADMFDAKTTPHIYVFSKEGKLVYKGLVDDDAKDEKGDKRVNHLRDVLGKLTKGEKVEPTSNKEEGCTIKRAAAAKAAAPAPTPGEKGGEKK